MGGGCGGTGLWVGGGSGLVRMGLSVGVAVEGCLRGLAWRRIYG